MSLRSEGATIRPLRIVTAGAVVRRVKTNGVKADRGHGRHPISGFDIGRRRWDCVKHSLDSGLEHKNTRAALIELTNFKYRTGTKRRVVVKPKVEPRHYPEDWLKNDFFLFAAN